VRLPRRLSQDDEARPFEMIRQRLGGYLRHEIRRTAMRFAASVMRQCVGKREDEVGAAGGHEVGLVGHGGASSEQMRLHPRREHFQNTIRDRVPTRWDHAADDEGMESLRLRVPHLAPARVRAPLDRRTTGGTPRAHTRRTETARGEEERRHNRAR